MGESNWAAIRTALPGITGYAIIMLALYGFYRWEQNRPVRQATGSPECIKRYADRHGVGFESGYDVDDVSRECSPAGIAKATEEHKKWVADSKPEYRALLASWRGLQQPTHIPIPPGTRTYLSAKEALGEDPLNFHILGEAEAGKYPTNGRRILARGWLVYTHPREDLSTGLSTSEGLSPGQSLGANFTFAGSNDLPVVVDIDPLPLDQRRFIKKYCGMFQYGWDGCPVSILATVGFVDDNGNTDTGDMGLVADGIWIYPPQEPK